jgi:integrase
VLRRFCDYLAIYDSQTEARDPRAFPRCRAVPPPRILSDEELGSFMSACRRVSPGYPQRGSTLTVVVGLLASTGLRSGEALRLDRADVDLIDGVLHIRKTKFRKDRLVPVHSTTLAALHSYARHRDRAFPAPRDPGFFLSSRGSRLSPSGLKAAFGAASKLAGFDKRPGGGKALRPHDLRHRFAVARLAVWHRKNADGQALPPLLATYLGHARYSDTAYYVTATADLLGMAADRAFAGGGVS